MIFVEFSCRLCIYAECLSTGYEISVKCLFIGLRNSDVICGLHGTSPL